MLLYQPQSGYRYNSDSLFLYDFINQFNPKGELLDVGAGCGIVGLLVARDNPKVKLDSVEKQEFFLKYLSKNIITNKIDCNIINNDFRELPNDKKYDFIVSNPPFYPDGTKQSENEVLQNARYSSNLPLSDFFKKVSILLKPHSHFVFCYDASVFGDICSALEDVKMRAVDVRFVHPKLDRKASIVMIHARNGSKSMMNVMAPLISVEDGQPSTEVNNIYKKAQTESTQCQI